MTGIRNGIETKLLVEGWDNGYFTISMDFGTRDPHNNDNSHSEFGRKQFYFRHRLTAQRTFVIN